MAFHCVSFGRTEYSFASRQEWWLCLKETEVPVPKSNFWTGLGQWKRRHSGLKWQHVWGRGRFPGRARGVTPATGAPDVQWSSVQLFDLHRCLWWFSEWVRSTVDTALWSSEMCSTQGIRNSEALHINHSSSPLSVFLLYFAEIITLLVVETNRYYHDHLDRLEEGPWATTWRDWGRNACVPCTDNTNGTLHTRQTDRLLVKGWKFPHNFLH